MIHAARMECVAKMEARYHCVCKWRLHILFYSFSFHALTRIARGGQGLAHWASPSCWLILFKVVVARIIPPDSSGSSSGTSLSTHLLLEGGSDPARSKKGKVTDKIRNRFFGFYQPNNYDLVKFSSFSLRAFKVIRIHQTLPGGGKKSDRNLNERWRAR